METPRISMKRIALLALVGCGGPKGPSQNPRDFPIEPPPDAATVEEEELPFVPLEAGSGAPPAGIEPVKITGSPGSSIAAAACIPAGVYQVSVDLSTAKLSQANTGMDDLTWCKSMLEAVPATAMATLEIKVEGNQLRLEWPPGHPQTIVSTGACSIGVTSPPMLATITFHDGGKATGATSYAVGSQNHPGESCSAVNAKLALRRQ